MHNERVEDTAAVVNLVYRRVHRSGADSRRGEGRGERELMSNRYTVDVRERRMEMR